MVYGSKGTFEPASFAEFGALLRFLRRRMRLSQRELSIAVGYSFAQISRLEQGKRTPDPAIVAAVFAPALDLATEPAWEQRLVALAQVAHVRRDADTRAVAIAADHAPAAAGAKHRAAPDGVSHAPLLATKLYLPRPRP
ncbi:MAG: helix-turn-helix transcriptional regulator, partial [Chloroflexales bacterium]|nr:helix-turn-helix transcriptional regulator [Chloroflexales bacterium]